MRKHVLLIAAILVAACAAEPTQQVASTSSSTTPAPVAPPTTVAPTPAVASTTGDGTAGSEAFIPPGGYEKKTRGSKTLYCKSETPVGTRFAKEYCFTQEQLEAKEANRSDAAKQMDRSRRTCTGGCSGG